MNWSAPHAAHGLYAAGAWAVCQLSPKSSLFILDVYGLDVSSIYLT